MTLKCLACLQPLPTDPGVTACPSCKWSGVADYRRDAAKHQPAWIVLAGFSGHGKTNLLHSLATTIDRLGQKLPDYFLRHRDTATSAHLKEIRMEAEGTELPEATTQTTERRLLLSLHHKPELGDRWLSVLDVRGELFTQKIDQLPKALPVLRESRVLWLVVSLHDLAGRSDGNTLDGLLQTLHTALETLGAAPTADARKRLIMVFTKAEKFVRFGDPVREYLLNDPLAGVSRRDVPVALDPSFRLKDYLKEVQAESEWLKAFVRTGAVDGGSQFLSMAAGMYYDVEFCVTSALGGDPQQSGTVGVRNPLRVLDPLVLTLAAEPQKEAPPPPPPRRVLLVLDGTAAPGPVFEAKLPGELWGLLQPHGQVTTYYLGLSELASHPGQRPPGEPNRPARPRMIGPILDKCDDPNTLVLVVSNGPVLDLADFRSLWDKRLVLVRTDGKNDDWPHKFQYRAGDAPASIVDLLIRTAPKPY